MNIYTIINERIPTNHSHDQGYIYFLIKDEEIVYVGQTVDIDTRITTHKKSKDFDSYNFIRCDIVDMDVIESVYIHAINPKLNGKTLGNGKKFLTEEKVAPINITSLCAMLVDYNRIKRGASDE